jgi:hypothetical protein
MNPVQLKLYWIIVVVTLGIYLTMLLWTMPHLHELTGGLFIFDLRPTGYTADEARTLLLAMGTDGRNFYAQKQQMLDLFYPAFLACSLAGGLFTLLPAKLSYPLAATAFASMMFDYLENHAVAGMLALDPLKLSEGAVAAANRWTVLKSMTGGLAMTALLIAVVAHIWKRYQAR